MGGRVVVFLDGFPGGLVDRNVSFFKMIFFSLSSHEGNARITLAWIGLHYIWGDCQAEGWCLPRQVMRGSRLLVLPHLSICIPLQALMFLNHEAPDFRSRALLPQTNSRSKSALRSLLSKISLWRGEVSTPILVWNCETQPPASIDWVALSSVIGCHSFVRSFVRSSRIGDISSHLHYMMFPSIQTIYSLWGYDPGNMSVSTYLLLLSWAQFTVV